MADDSKLKRKKKGGWIEVVEDAPEPSAPAPAVVAVTSALDVPATADSLSMIRPSDGFTKRLETVLRSTIGPQWWDQFMHLNDEGRTKVLEVILNEIPTVPSAQSLANDLRKRDLLGSVAVAVRLSEDWLDNHGVPFELSPDVTDSEERRILTLLNRRDFPIGAQ